MSFQKWCCNTYCGHWLSIYNKYTVHSPYSSCRSDYTIKCVRASMCMHRMWVGAVMGIKWVVIDLACALTLSLAPNCRSWSTTAVISCQASLNFDLTPDDLSLVSGSKRVWASVESVDTSELINRCNVLDCTEGITESHQCYMYIHNCNSCNVQCICTCTCTQF